jgi:hypothetical protein
VPAEPELVRPAAHPLLVDLGVIASVPGARDHPARVVAAAEALELVRLLDPVSDAAGVLGRLGRVLRDVPRHTRSLSRVGAQVERAHIVLASPSVRVGVGGLGRNSRLGQRGDDRVGEQLRVERLRRRSELVADAVESPERVEVDDAAALELGDLDVRHAHPLARVLLREARLAGELALDVGTRALEQPARVVVPQRAPLVVEAVRADRLAEARIVIGVAPAARQRAPVRAGLAAAARAARQPPTARLANRVHWAEARGGDRREHERMLGHRLWDALAAAESGHDQLPCIAAIDLRARPAHVGAPVPARREDDPVRLAVRAELAHHLPRA